MVCEAGKDAGGKGGIQAGIEIVRILEEVNNTEEFLL